MGAAQANGYGANPPQEAKLHTIHTPVFVPAKPVDPDKASVVALDLFGSFLVNSPEEAKGFGNVLVGWDQIPKFSAEHLNNKDGQVPNDHSVNFRISGQEAKLTLFPGTFYPKKGSKPMRRYPGVKEQQVEQALIHHATIQAEEQTMNGDTTYYVTFTINALARWLKAMGSTMSNTQIRQALDVLSSSVMTLSYGEDLKLDNRDTILPSFDRNNNSKDGNNGDDIWRVKLHKIIVQSILKVTYRQYPIGQLKHYSPVGAAIMRRIHYIITNVSEGQPYKFTCQEMKMVTAGLNHVRLSGSMQAISKELERMKGDDYLESYTVEEIFPEVRGRGRPTPIDYRFTLYPGPEWIKNMKAGSMRQNITEQRLSLARSKRPDRHNQLLLSID